MGRRYVFVVLAVLWGIVGLPGAKSWALDTDKTAATLRGLPGVRVVIEELKPEIERAGLTQQQLRTDVELRLRQVGIVVLTREEWLQAPEAPWLYINVNVLLIAGIAGYVFNIDVHVNQQAYLARNFSEAYDVTTWSVGITGSVGASRLSTYVRGLVRDYVDKFINAYLSVHPRHADSVAAPVSPAASSRQTLIREVQERLHAVGFNPGTIDSTMGPQTRDALRRFQSSQGILSTGELDEKTLDALGVR